MTCTSLCPNEKIQQDEASPGPVQNDEKICRAAYGKTMHYNNSGKVRPSFVKNNDLLAGSLSVWRRFSNTESELGDITKTLSETGPSDATLYDLFSAETGRVREIRVTTLPAIQALHVFDDCRTDESGGKHPNHAVVAICRELKPESLSKDSPEYLEIRDELVKLFK